LVERPEAQKAHWIGATQRKIDNNDQFVFHMDILDDLGFLERDDREPGFGLTRGLDGHMSWSVLPLRLTAQGHHFIEALRNKEVWATLKRDFKRRQRQYFMGCVEEASRGLHKKEVRGATEGRRFNITNHGAA
jgi:Hypothetical protein (DUF2513)